MHLLTGACQCRDIKFESTAKPLALFICHCKECQKQSTSAFGISLRVSISGFKLIQGLPNYWQRKADSGRIIKCAFCNHCGSRVWHEPESNPEAISIKAGSLDKPIDLSNAVHLWVSRKLLGVIIPENAKQFLGEPDEN